MSDKAQVVVTLLGCEVDENGQLVLSQRRLTYGDVIARRQALSRQLVDPANCDPTLAQFHDVRKEDKADAIATR